MGIATNPWSLTCKRQDARVIVFASGVAISHRNRADVQIFGSFPTLASGKSCAMPIAISESSENVPSRINQFVKSQVHLREYTCQTSGPIASFASFSSQGALRSRSPSRQKLLFVARMATSSRFHASSVTPPRDGSFYAPSWISIIRKPAFLCAEGTQRFSVLIATRILFSPMRR